MGPDELRLLAVEVAEAASRLLAERACSDLTDVVRGDTIRADLVAEDVIREAIRRSLSDFTMVSEESGVAGSTGYVFVVDPLDGSLNYEHCIRWSSVSVAVAPPGSRRLSDVVAGAVAPLWGETLSFARGEGCYEGNRRVYPRASGGRIAFTYVESLDDAVKVSRLFTAFPGLKMRSLGSAALEIASVGLGRGLLFVDLRGKLRNVDVAAAVGLARECGARVFNETGADVDSTITEVSVVGNVIVARGDHRAILEAISGGGSAPNAVPQQGHDPSHA